MKTFLRNLTLWKLLKVCASLLVLKIVLVVLLSYREYFPPNFQTEFLRGRESHFFGSYQWAFYAHILAGPLSLVLGLLLISGRLRHESPRWHRRIGRVQGMNVLLLVAPSGLWMAYWAEAGPIAAAGFAVLALLTGLCVALGWRAAVLRQFAAHRVWMMRTFVLLSSAVVIRLIGGLATAAGFYAPWIDPAAAWVSWLAPLLVYEKFRQAGMSRVPAVRMATTVAAG